MKAIVFATKMGGGHMSAAQAVAVAHKLDVQPLDFFQRIHHIRALKGPDDAVEIIFVSRGEISLNQIVEHTLSA